MKKFNFTINGNNYEVSVNNIENDIADVEVNGTSYQVEIKQPETENPSQVATAKNSPNPVASVAGTGAVKKIKSPLPGNVFKVLVTNGQSVKKGDVLLVLESMKMENNILAEFDGIVKNVLVSEGQSILQDDALIEFAENGGAPAQPVATQSAPASAPKAQAQVSKPATGKGGVLKSPLPGNVFKVHVSNGQAVKKGDVLLVLESMKMENNIHADHDGTIKNVLVSEGQSIMQDDVLIEFEGSSSTNQAPVAAPQVASNPEPVQAPAQKKSTAKGFVVKSPLPGNVFKVVVSNGQAVKKGDVLLVLESMKMENNIHADFDGTIKNVLVSEGQSIMQDDALIEFE
jgi:biotin carboxyl carrier protein